MERHFYVLESYYGELLGVNDFSKLNTQLTIVATNLTFGKSTYFSEGEIIRPLMASSCIPGIFDPIAIGDDLYVDGGVLNNMPTDPLEGSCDFVIGVNCNHLPEQRNIGNIKSLIERTVIMAMNCNVYHRRDRCDFFMEPLGLGGYGVFDIKKAKEIFENGYVWAAEQISSDKRLAALGSLDEMG